MRSIVAKGRKAAVWATLVAVVIAAPSVAVTQSTSADIVGAIRDPSGAVVPNVTVKIVQEETNFTRETASNTEGIYEFRILPPGTCTLTAEATGFKRYANERLPLVSGQVLRIAVPYLLAAVAARSQPTSWVLFSIAEQEVGK